MLILTWIPKTSVTMAGTVWLDRKNAKDAVKAMNAAGEEMKRKKVSNRAILFFPSGKSVLLVHSILKNSC